MDPAFELRKRLDWAPAGRRDTDRRVCFAMAPLVAGGSWEAVLQSLGYPEAGVDHVDEDVAVDLAPLDRHRPAWAVVFHRVGEQVQQHLLEALKIGEYKAVRAVGPGRKIDLAVAGGQADKVGHLGHQIGQPNRFEGQHRILVGHGAHS